MSQRIPTIWEIKRRLDGGEEAYQCQLLHLDQSLAILHYTSPREYVFQGQVLPAGSITVGFYWPDRNYILWRITSPQGHLLGHRLDICRDVTIGPLRVEWTDLILDLWLDPEGSARFLDEDELGVLSARGLVSQELQRLIEATRNHLEKNLEDILAEAEGELQRLQRPPPEGQRGNPGYAD